MRVRVFQHVPFEGLGSIADWLATRQAAVATTRFDLAPRLPAAESFDLLVVLGGPMGVNDEAELPWLAAEKRFIGAAVRAGTPVLGVCLGAQLIASALGARVYRGTHQEIGWFPVTACAHAGDTFAFPPTLDAFHWHGDTFELPSGAIQLARSAACAQQALQFGARCIGLQCHLETTPANAQTMVEHCRHELVPAPYVQDAATILAAPPARYAALTAQMTRVLDYLVR
ncbi:MAG: type 1 glutamine amidotransferase [Rhodanobacter sp.]|nr:MAG: type 1 glutamine amidotransferase [Rhodanobacter sp.]TAM14251.1 MAG: type 1 glutamine amidotransferase [Rhodanobacter sp.]TAM34823.1 MAG: type 1 glutamine amidotransferase [Rhodanobacter sp.]